MLENTLIVVAGLVVGAIVAVLVIAATRPDTFRVQRVTSIQAPPEKIFPHINDFHNWTAWSPWDKIDPQLQRIYTGATSGKGAVYEWEGNKKVGKGRMEITESVIDSLILIQLDFFKPFNAHYQSEFTLKPQGSSTEVSWAMSGRKPFLFKIITLFMNMDKMVGKDFEKGLASLKSIAEA